MQQRKTHFILDEMQTHKKPNSYGESVATSGRSAKSAETQIDRKRFISHFHNCPYSRIVGSKF